MLCHLWKRLRDAEVRNEAIRQRLPHIGPACSATATEEHAADHYLLHLLEAVDGVLFRPASFVIVQPALKRRLQRLDLEEKSEQLEEAKNASAASFSLCGY